MYECRCAADGKKLTEMARPPLNDLTYHYRCRCGQDRIVPASVDPLIKATACSDSSIELLPSHDLPIVINMLFDENLNVCVLQDQWFDFSTCQVYCLLGKNL